MTNEELIQELIRDGYLKSPRIVEAFRKIDRKDFVPVSLQGEAYENYPLPIGEGQTISQPLTVAFMLELLQPKPGEKILDVGSGSGWTTALLAQTVTSDKGQEAKGMVVAVERVPELCKIGEVNIRKYNFIENGIVKYFCGDASRGVPKKLLPAGGFDKILVGAAVQVAEIRRSPEGQRRTGVATQPQRKSASDQRASALGDYIPQGWKEQLKIGGRIVAPVGNSIFVVDKVPEFSAKGACPSEAGRRRGPALGWKTKEHFGFSFVPLVLD